MPLVMDWSCCKTNPTSTQCASCKSGGRLFHGPIDKDEITCLSGNEETAHGLDHIRRKVLNNVVFSRSLSYSIY